MEKVRINASMRTNAVKPLNPNPRPVASESGARPRPWPTNWTFKPEEMWSSLFPKPKADCGWCPNSGRG